MVIRKIRRGMSSSSSSINNDGSGGPGSAASLSCGEARRLRKLQQISACLDGYGADDGGGGRGFEVDLWRLRELCLTRGGLVNAEMRQRAWHKLLGINAALLDDPDDGGWYAQREADNMDAAGIEKEEVGLIRRDVGRSVYFRLSKVGDAVATAATDAAGGEGEKKAGGDEEPDSVTVSTCALTADGGGCDASSQSVNQAANRQRTVSLASELTVDWSGNDGGSLVASPLHQSVGSVSPLADAESENPSSSPVPSLTAETNKLGSGNKEEEDAESRNNEGEEDSKALEWERQNLLMSLIISAIAPRKYEAFNPRSLDGSNGGDEDDDRLHCEFERVAQSTALLVVSFLFSPGIYQCSLSFLVGSICIDYQGFHDVASIILLQLSPENPQLASAILRRLGRHHLRDNMREDFDLLTASLEAVFFPLLKFFDEAVHDFLTHCGLNSASVLSWILTWFAHDVKDAETAGRLFDAFLASHPAMPLYLAVAVVAHPAHRKILFANECCPAMIHVAVGGLLAAVGGSSCDWTDDGECAQGIVTFQHLIDDAISFMRKVPPSALPSLAKRYSGTLATSSPRGRRRKRANNNPIPSSSVLIRPLPSWSTAPMATADWVLEQRQRQSLQRRGQLPSRKKIGVGAAIRRKCSPTSSSLLTAPCFDALNTSAKDEENVKEENLRAKAAAGLAVSLCDDDMEMMISAAEMRRSSSSLSASSGGSIRSARNVAGAFGSLVRGIRVTAGRSRIETG